MATKELEELEKRLEKLENELQKYKIEEDEDDEITLLQKVNMLKLSFFQVPENKEEYKTWKEKFKESYYDFNDYINSITEFDEEDEEEFDEEKALEDEEDVDFLFTVINYCFSVIPQNEEQQECINKRFASALNNIAQRLKYKTNENGEIEMPF